MRLTAKLFITASIFLLSACGSDSTPTTTNSGTGNGSTGGSTTASKHDVPVFSSIKNCEFNSTTDVANCPFEKGVYVLNVEPTKISAKEQQAVVDRVDNLLNWASNPVREQFKNHTIVLGIIPSEDDVDSNVTEAGQFVINLAFDNSAVIDGIELIYQDQNNKNETGLPTTYQKLIQLFDYYLDGQTGVGDELQIAYSTFKVALPLIKDQVESASPLSP